MIDPLSDEQIIDSWQTNAAPWTDAIRESRIASRVLITNDAIIDAVMSRAPRTILDVGCGEGWLVRVLAQHGVQGTGVDVVPELVDRAQRAGGGTFRVVSYESIAAGELHLRADVVVANFALIGKDAVEGMMRRIPAMLEQGGAFIVQTLHPVSACGDAPYEDGWRNGSWAGFGGEFSNPAPWYFRTLESWKNLFAECGFTVADIREPINRETGMPASVIFIAEPAC